MKKIKEMNGTEKRAWTEVKNAFDWVVGGHENSVCDGYDEEMPSYEALVEEIYETVMTCTTKPGYQSMRPCDEVRFAGKEFIMECIEHLMDNGDFQYEVKHEEKTEEAGQEVKPAEKKYWCIGRVKENIRTQPFNVYCIRANSKKDAENVLFANNIAPFQNKIFTKQQLVEMDENWRMGLGIGDLEFAMQEASGKEVC